MKPEQPMQQKLTIAVPSKGRLQDNAMAFFARAGLILERSRGSRDYRGTVAGMSDIEVLFLSASEIVSQLAKGSAHLGVTGEDLVREQTPDADNIIELITPLGFGHANVVVAVPQAWIDVSTMADLDEVASDIRRRSGQKMRVATKYVNLTRKFFADHGIHDYRIVESMGATEGAPASGAAEIIVDITSTGSTLAANALKVLNDGVILRSEANLIASCKADWSPDAKNAVRHVLTRIAAEEEARRSREIRVSFDAAQRATILAAIKPFQFLLPFDTPDTGLILHCCKPDVFPIVDALLAAGGRNITVHSFEYIFRTDNPLLSKLMARL